MIQTSDSVQTRHNLDFQRHDGQLAGELDERVVPEDERVAVGRAFRIPAEHQTLRAPSQVVFRVGVQFYLPIFYQGMQQSMIPEISV